MKRFLTTGFLFISLSLLPVACGIFCNDSCGCNPSFPQQTIRIRSLEMLTFSTGRQQISSNNIQPFDQVVKAFRIKEFDLLGDNGLDISNSGILGFAYACSPPPAISEKKLISIKVINLEKISLKDGTELSVGEDISNLFVISNFFIENPTSIQSYLKEGKILFLDELHKMGFTKEPSNPTQLKLNFIFGLENGTELLISNEILSISPKS